MAVSLRWRCLRGVCVPFEGLTFGDLVNVSQVPAARCREVHLSTDRGLQGWRCVEGPVSCAYIMCTMLHLERWQILDLAAEDCKQFLMPMFGS